LWEAESAEARLFSLLSQDRARRFRILRFGDLPPVEKPAGSPAFDLCLARLGSRSPKDLLREIRAVVGERPVLLLGEREDREEECLSLGAADYLTEDAFSIPLLVRSARYVLDRRSPPNDPLGNQSLYRMILENGSDIILMIRANGAIQYISPTVEAVLGYSPEELLGKDVFEFVHPEDRDLALANLEIELREPGTAPITLNRIRHRDGGWRYMESWGMDVTGRTETGGIFLASRDVTRRKEAERELEESVALLRATLDATTDGIIGVDWSGKITVCNQQFREMWRIPPNMTLRDTEAAVSFVKDQLVDPDGFEARLRELYARPGSRGYDVIEFKDGRRFERISKPHQVRDEFVGRICCYRDLTDKKRAEADLRLVAARARCIFWIADIERIGDAFDWTLRIPDEAAAQQVVPLNVPPGGDYTTAWSESRDKEDEIRIDRNSREALLAGKTSYQQEFRCYDRRGKEHWLLEDVYIEPLIEGRWRAVGVCTDITERKLADRRLEESEQRYRSLFEYNPDAVYSLDLNGIVILANPAASSITGYGPDELIGKSAQDFVIAEELASVESQVQRTLEGTPQNFETAILSKSGQRIELYNSLLPVVVDGDLTGIFGVSKDITKRKRAEEALRQSQKLESLGVLAGGIAHDFNNLLTGILGQSSLALSRLSESSDLRPHLERMVQAAERAADLTRQLLAYAGKAEYERRPIDLNALVRENVNFLGATIPKTVALEFRLKDDPSFIEGDRGQLQQVVMNLVINAAEATAERGGSVTVSTRSIRLSEEDAALYFTGAGPLGPGEYVRLEVADTGSGMSAETMARIFDPFFTTKDTGRGLGLSATQGIIQGHKGGLKVRSKPGDGTTFDVVFPALAGFVAPEDSAPPPARSLKGGVLVIDDEEMVRETTRDILTIGGMSTLLASNGKEGLEIYRAHRDEISAVILDMQMPVMSGEETLRRLRRIDPNVFVLLSSGHNEAEARSIYRIGEDSDLAYLQKPYSSVTLLSKIGEAVWRASSEKA
jgi:PAS domain S-box-containing protein